MSTGRLYWRTTARDQKHSITGCPQETSVARDVNWQFTWLQVQRIQRDRISGTQDDSPVSCTVDTLASDSSGNWSCSGAALGQWETLTCNRSIIVKQRQENHYNWHTQETVDLTNRRHIASAFIILLRRKRIRNIQTQENWVNRYHMRLFLIYAVRGAMRESIYNRIQYNTCIFHQVLKASLSLRQPEEALYKPHKILALVIDHVSIYEKETEAMESHRGTPTKWRFHHQVPVSELHLKQFVDLVRYQVAQLQKQPPYLKYTRWIYRITNIRNSVPWPISSSFV